MPEITLEQQLAAARRELGLRKRVYPSFVQRGTLTPAQAEHELAAMAAIVETLERLATTEEQQQLLGFTWPAPEVPHATD